MCCTKYGLNYMYPIGFGEVDYQIFAISFFSPLGKGYDPSFEELVV